MKKPITPTQRMLNMWAIILILWSIYRTYYGTELPIWFDEFIAKPLIFIFPLVVYIQKIEKKNVFEAIDLKLKGIQSDLTIALLAGGTFIISGIIVYLFRYSSLPPIFMQLSLASAINIIAVSFASSISEEILSRGFVLKRLYEESKNSLSSVFFASFLFFFLHIPILFTNPEIRGNMLLQVMATDLLLSFAVSYIYLQRKNVIVPIIIHALYNLSIYLLV